MAEAAKKRKKPPAHRPQCGSVAGYRQHTKRGERSCDQCREANRLYMAEYKRKRGDAPRKPTQAQRRERDEKLGDTVLALTSHDGEYPAFLRRGGRELWDSVRSEFELSPSGEVLLLEACRLKDRLDRFTAALSAESTLWFELQEPEELKDGTMQMQVVVNSMVSEARQAQAALGQTLNKVGVLKQAEKRSSGVSMADQLRQKREARLAAARSGEGA